MKFIITDLDSNLFGNEVFIDLKKTKIINGTLMYTVRGVKNGLVTENEFEVLVNQIGTIL
jgi:hypothetical protein